MECLSCLEFCTTSKGDPHICNQGICIWRGDPNVCNQRFVFVEAHFKGSKHCICISRGDPQICNQGICICGSSFQNSFGAEPIFRIRSVRKICNPGICICGSSFQKGFWSRVYLWNKKWPSSLHGCHQLLVKPLPGFSSAVKLFFVVSCGCEATQCKQVRYDEHCKMFT